MDYWLPVDQYIGGIEHAVLHLLYARFFTKVLRDLGLVADRRAFQRLLTQGMVLKDGAKMAKSKGNVVDPEYMIDEYGTDTTRLFLLFAAPPERDLEWSDQGVAGRPASCTASGTWSRTCCRTLKGVAPYQGPGAESPPDSAEFRHKVHADHQKGDRGYRGLLPLQHRHRRGDGTGERLLPGSGEPAPGAAALAVFREALEAILLLLNPMVPHIAEELWQALGHTTLLLDVPWPQAQAEALAVAALTVVIQVNGKVRSRLVVPASGHG